jgi:glycosyltransferase involved in cell wall biosynthesis
MSSTMRLIESGKTGLLIDMNSPEGMAAGLAELIDMGPERRARIGTAAAARLAAEFSRERRLPDILDALDIKSSTLPQSGPRLLEFDEN